MRAVIGFHLHPARTGKDGDWLESVPARLLSHSAQPACSRCTKPARPGRNGTQPRFQRTWLGVTSCMRLAWPEQQSSLPITSFLHAMGHVRVEAAYQSRPERTENVAVFNETHSHYQWAVAIIQVRTA